MSKASPSIQSVLTILFYSNSNVGELENRLEEKPITRKMRDSVQRRRKPQKRTVASFKRVHVKRSFAEMDVNKTIVPVQSTGAYMMKTPFQQPCTMYGVPRVISQIMTAAITHFHSSRWRFNPQSNSGREFPAVPRGPAVFGYTDRPVGVVTEVRRKIVKPPVERPYRGSPSVSIQIRWDSPPTRMGSSDYVSSLD